jgi:hypothetical protein
VVIAGGQVVDLAQKFVVRLEPHVWIGPQKLKVERDAALALGKSEDCFLLREVETRAR